MSSDVHGCCGGGQQRYGARDGCCRVQFVASRDQDSWQRMIVAGCDVNRLQRKIAAGRFLPQGSLLAAIKEDGSERSLLAALCSERCIYDVDTEDSSGLMDLRLGERRWMKATSKEIVGIAWKMEATEMATGQQECGSDTR
ncbi:hypothetical protein B296_00028623 [Ensete ventricosum]|uniref:Uncharacterized protein n=1 Tax=Ensete ventricosum TaxID=4639 RepID=A0A426ZNI0_ENSVE|nr:hypothetical protein B296_00028623 [Ensete ventricosum]